MNRRRAIRPIKVKQTIRQYDEQEQTCFWVKGKTALRGEVQIAGAKNSALPLLAVSLLTQEPLHLRRVPDLLDVEVMLRLLEHLGVQVTRSDGQLSLVVKVAAEPVAPAALTSPIRASFLVLGPLLATRGEARVAMPGGDDIGGRPVDEHLRGFAALGAEISIESGEVVAHAKAGLKGADIQLATPSVTGTANLLMAAILASGKTRISNAAREPEIVDLAKCLRQMGADIEGEGSDCLQVHGVRSLSGTNYKVMPDRIEAGSYLIGAAATSGLVRVNGIGAELLVDVLDKLEASGADLHCSETSVQLDMQGRRPKAVNIETSPYPGFPTDLQSSMMVLNALAEGESSIKEKIFENRFLQVDSLKRMGAQISRKCQMQIDIKGCPTLMGAELEASDLRSAFALTLAAIAAEGESQISGIHHMDRGYEQADAKLRALKADVRRMIWPVPAVFA